MLQLLQGGDMLPWQAEMYGAIGEEDVLAGLWKRRCRTENTRAGEMLMQVP
jgi:hypothetical protein